MRYILALFAFFLALSSFTFAATLLVDDAGPWCLSGLTAYSTIQAAVNAASAGDTIFVCRHSAGSYSENVVVDKTINLYGVGDSVVISAASPLRPVIQVAADSVRLANFTVRDATSPANALGVGAGIVAAANNLQIYNVSAQNNFYGFYFGPSSNSNFSNNTATDNLDTGFNLNTGSNNNLISNNFATNNSEHGFVIAQSSGNTFTRNVARNNVGLAYYLSSASGNTFTSNVAFRSPALTSEPDGAFFLNVNCGGNTFTSNTVSGGTFGFSLEHNASRNSFISNNVSNAEVGFSLQHNNHNNTFTSNIVYNTSLGGFWLSHSADDNVLTSNVVYNVRSPPEDEGGVGSGFIIADASNRNTLTSNQAYNNSQYGFAVLNSNQTDLGRNNASRNDQAQYYFADALNATFVDTNYALNVPSGATILNVTGIGSISALAGGVYNRIVTNTLNFSFWDARNVSFVRTNINVPAESVEASSCTGGGACRLVSNLLFINGLPAGARINQLLIVYNQSKISGPFSESDIQLARYNYVIDQWGALGVSELNTANDYVRYGPIATFGTFGAVAFNRGSLAPLSIPATSVPPKQNATNSTSRKPKVLSPPIIN